MITLIALVLLVGGIVISWSVGFVRTQRSEVQFCSKAQILLQEAYYNPDKDTVNLVVMNTGKVPLTGFTLLTTYGGGLVNSSKKYGSYELGVDSLGLFVFDMSPDLQEIVVQSRRCKGAQDMVTRYDVEGL